MGAKGEETRARLVQATRALTEAQGYFGTGLNQVLSESRAPRGSLYFHFPSGKDELVGQALTEAGREISTLIAACADGSPAATVVDRLITALATRMADSDYTKGCPLATVALEVSASNEPLRRLCATAYTDWQHALADLLTHEGHPPATAEATASTTLALIEGALLLARVHRSRHPLDQAARTLTTLLAPPT
ncbi:TetR/AcrR family transcriptional regulator [Kitasatospora sp. MMS16-BH015]|uniref:TetR/AcrR family transcriptional regulator n=1 Tax=Kitasatospora sp. MMS16-BH015 TaxID=2018025 RepID=UPI000CF2E7E0|nr:TetR/AcrR family transcriptional regulator [Kitasatospora sp. MMS16-BH015]